MGFFCGRPFGASSVSVLGVPGLHCGWVAARF